jgi:CheY-like chemotaxis protein
MSENLNAKKILVADDSLTIQKVIRLALSGDGYEIQTVSNGKEALEQASLFRPDIFIIDVSLPVFDAYQVREHLMNKPDLKNIPVILMSSAFEKVDENRSRKLGFAGHLIKPFDPSHLRSTLLSVSTSAPVNDPVIATINTPIEETFQHNDPLGLNLPPLNQSGFIEKPLDDMTMITKNTFEISGLDQQDWGTFEPARLSDAEFASPNHHASTFSGSEVSGVDMDPISPETVSFSNGYEDYGSTQSPHQFSISANELEVMIKTEVAKTLEIMHASIQEKIMQDLLSFNQQQLPALAEKILKEEIHKLLSEPPV